MPNFPDEPDTNEPVAMPENHDSDILLSGETATTGMDESETGEPTKAPAGDAPAGVPIDRPRLTPQGRSGDDPEGEDETDPMGGVKQGQGDKAEG